MFSSIDEMWEDILRDLSAQQTIAPSRDGDVVGEIIGYNAALNARRGAIFLGNKRRALSAAYASAEFLWYASGRGDVEMLAQYAPSYKKYADPSGQAYGAYGPRIMSQLPRVVELLRRDGFSRQTVVAVWRPDDLEAAGKTPDMPCTLTHQYLLRDNALHMIVTMRSNDVWRGMPYDVFTFCCLQRVIAAHLDVDVGVYHHQVGSMHLYARDADKARESLTSDAIVESEELGWRLDDTLTTCELAVARERQSRVAQDYTASLDALGDMTRAMVTACRQDLRRKKDSCRISSFVMDE